MVCHAADIARPLGLGIVCCWILCGIACIPGEQATRDRQTILLTPPPYRLLPQDTALFARMMQKKPESKSYAIHLSAENTFVANLIFRYWTLTDHRRQCRVDEEDFYTRGGQLGPGLQYRKKSLRVFCDASLVFELMHIESNGQTSDFVIEKSGHGIHIRGEKQGKKIERSITDLPTPFGICKQKLLSMQVGEEVQSCRFDPDALTLELTRHILIHLDKNLLKFQIKERSQQVEVWFDATAQVVKMVGMGLTFVPCSVDLAMAERQPG